ncbi:MAG: HNH endonuclease [Pseudomonadota bacterium]
MGTSKNRGPANARFITRRSQGEKQCSRCREWRSLADFVRDHSRYDGRGYVCKDCRMNRRVAAGPNKPERQRRAALGEKWCRGCKAWLSKEAVRQGACADCLKAEARARYAADPNVRKRYRGQSAARRRGVAPLPVEAQEILTETFGGLCAYCDEPATSWDHVAPVSSGGLTEPGNIVPACRTCNSSKRAQDVWEWLEANGREAKTELLDVLILVDVGLTPPRGTTAL